MTHHRPFILPAALFCFCALFFTPLLAQAQLTSAVYVLPKALEFLPDRSTATQVVMHGVFIGNPNNPNHRLFVACGKMYFACPKGNEARCRQQWNLIADAIGSKLCQGFSTVTSANLPTLFEESAPLGSPDVWDISADIVPDDYVQKRCPVANFEQCPIPQPMEAGCAIGRGGAVGGDLEVLATLAAALLCRPRRLRRARVIPSA